MTHIHRSIEVPGLAHNAPIPLGARVGPLICSSGIAGKDSSTGQLPSDAEEQVTMAFANLDRFLAAANAQLSHVAKLTILLKDNSLRDAINKEWLQRFPDPVDRPARHIVHQELQHGMLIQLEVIAFVS